MTDAPPEPEHPKDPVVLTVTVRARHLAAAATAVIGAFAAFRLRKLRRKDQGQ
jgi:hypothetical protein